ncbi:efflux RND transporter periplasmic adaptor subunit [Lichenibacterium minor]|uniref:Efflux RND transporter periplasmic adaptor subunit n=1 Tax=Lichenibacterium minor TaxID=2316528 RepID=A0A4Q2U156_9HYPH|nr:efflux RND transporter periplasmic adaptor subunit [Lichenibacterium minor]RYC30179.1 efflux RND transporter periplasmic adaptor subunit [Lichenibacterium minor]
MDRADSGISTLDRVERPQDGTDRAERPQERPSAPAAPSAPVQPAGPSTPPRRGRGFGWLVFLLLLAGLGWAGDRFLWPRIEALRGGGAAHARPPGSGAPQPVGAATIGTGDMQVVLTGIGTVTPLATITVQTQISGQLMEVGYKEGQMVKQGDFLAQIDPRPYQIALEQAEGALAHDTGLLDQAKSDLDRYNTLNRQDSIAKQTYADQRFVVQQDEGLVKEDQATIDTAKLNLAYCHIVSPVAGRVGLRLVDPGNYLTASSATGLVVVTQLQPISVIFDLPEDDVAAVQKQMAAGPALAVAAYDRTDTAKVADGTLTTVDNTVDTTTGTVKLRATYSNADGALFPNQFVNARLLLRTLRGAVRVPTAAVQHGAPGTYVYLVKPDDTVAVATIRTGVTDGEFQQVLDGLKPGDRVVVDGTDRLREGAKVRITPDAADPAATPQAPPPGEAAGSAGGAPADGQRGEASGGHPGGHRRGRDGQGAPPASAPAPAAAPAPSGG